jgi:hypothetical protein
VTEKPARCNRVEWDYIKGVTGVYAVTMPIAFAVKIGWSSDIAKRMQSYVTSMPFTPILMGHMQSDDPSVEKGVHRALKAHRLHGEWFLWCDEVKSYLEQFFVCSGVPADEVVCALPLKEIARCDDSAEAISLLESLDRSYNALDPRTRDLICRGCEANGDDPLTIDDFARLAGGAPDGFFPEGWRAVRERLARKMRWLGDYRNAAILQSKQPSLHVDLPTE